MLEPRDVVTLNVPDNPRLHGARAEIVSLTEWGAHVATEAAATGKFRALYAEMLPVREDKIAVTATANPSGEVCSNCGGVNMVRAGACLCCQDCGTSGGCS